MAKKMEISKRVLTHPLNRWVLVLLLLLAIFPTSPLAWLIIVPAIWLFFYLAFGMTVLSGFFGGAPAKKENRLGERDR